MGKEKSPGWATGAFKEKYIGKTKKQEKCMRDIPIQLIIPCIFQKTTKKQKKGEYNGKINNSWHNSNRCINSGSILRIDIYKPENFGVANRELQVKYEEIFMDGGGSGQ